MMNFDIRLSIYKLKVSSSTIKKGLNDRVLLRSIYSFCEHLKGVYVNLVIEKVNSSRYMGKWEPVEDEGYLEYLGVTPKVDILNLFRESLEIKKIGYNVYLRVNPEIMYPESDLTVLTVLRALENGTSNFPARPVLYKVAKKIDSDLIDLWLDWLIDKGLSERR